MTQQLTTEQGRLLTSLARRTIAHELAPPPATEADHRSADLSTPALQEKMGTFVTLKIRGQLRGCMGNLVSSESIVNGIKKNAVIAAFHDPRFSPLRAEELPETDIEISILTEASPLSYKDGKDLPARLRPYRDGVIIKKGAAGATFLPQVWDQLPGPEEFLNHLCRKAGLADEAWRTGDLEVSTYQVQHFQEEK